MIRCLSVLILLVVVGCSSKKHLKPAELTVPSFIQEEHVEIYEKFLRESEK